jgi:predicted aspartyl protease
MSVFTRRPLSGWVLSIFLIVSLLLSSHLLRADSCTIAAAHVPENDEKAMLAADYEKAAGLYRQELAAKPNDPALVAGLTRVLLRQQKASDALELVNAAIATHPGSSVLLETRAEIEYRQGLPWHAAQTITEAGKVDPCNPRVHYMLARIASLNSYYAVARARIVVAHRLDPFDPDIRGMWIGTLSPRERVAELEAYLSTPTGDDAEVVRRNKQALEHLKRTLAEPRKPCRLVSAETSTQIPFSQLMYDATHIRAFGLGVKLNGHGAKLEIDTGAGGLVVSRSVAAHAGIKPFSDADVGGIGDKGVKTGYRGFADTIQIGGLEFHDCVVTVVDNSRMMDIDGLIGMDVFSHFLITLDYPDRRLMLGPLPPRPGETAVQAPSLGTASDDSDTAKGGDAPSAQEDKSADDKGSTGASANGNAANKPKPSSGPHDRYIAPEMKDYTAVYRYGHTLMLPVALNQSKLKLLILDTGAWATSISPASAREVTKVRSNDRQHVRGLNGEVEKVYSADEITFSFARVSQNIRDVPSFDTAGISKDIGLEISGFLGARTLELTTIHIDYRDGLVKFDYDPKKAAFSLPR